jgi:hypothetical protein
VRLLRASIAGEASARGERARKLGKQARERINVDFDVDNPNTPPRASQKLVSVVTLLRAMPAPSTPEARNLHHEAQALIEQAAIQQAESSASRIHHQGSAWDDWGVQDPEASDAYRRRGRAARQPTAHAGQGADPRHARVSPRRRHAQRHQRPADGQRGDAGGSGLPPPTGWAL